MAKSLRWSVLAISTVIIGCAGPSKDLAGYSSHTYKTGRMIIERPFDEVKQRLWESLAPFTAADAYARYDAGATREDFAQGAPRPKGQSRPYMVYEVRWEVPIYLDTGERKKIYRIGLGGGPGRPLLGEYPGSGLHVLPAIQMYADGDSTTVLEFIVPSSQYAAAFPDTPEVRELARTADERFFGFLDGLD